MTRNCPLKFIRYTTPNCRLEVFSISYMTWNCLLEFFSDMIWNCPPEVTSYVWENWNWFFLPCFFLWWRSRPLFTLLLTKTVMSHLVHYKYPLLVFSTFVDDINFTAHSFKSIHACSNTIVRSFCEYGCISVVGGRVQRVGWNVTCRAWMYVVLSSCLLLETS